MLSARLLTAVLAFATVQGATAQSQPQPTPCFRWSGQVAIANKPGQAPGSGVNASTLWYYGGEAMTSQGQTSDLWTNALIALPLDQGAPLVVSRCSAAFALTAQRRQIGRPERRRFSSSSRTAVISRSRPQSPVSLLPRSRSVPVADPSPRYQNRAVGALWASSDGNRLYSWGGQFQDTPSVPPPPARTFVYDIQKGEWDVVQTGGDKVGGAAEGQPAIVPLLGQGGDNVAYCELGFGTTHAGDRILPKSELDVLHR